MSLSSITLLSIAEILGDFGFKEFARHNTLSGFIQGTAGYIGVIFTLIRALRIGNVTYVNGMWDGVSGLIETIAAYVILGERLNSPWQYMGIVLICIGLLVLKSGGISS